MEGIPRLKDEGTAKIHALRLIEGTLAHGDDDGADAHQHLVPQLLCPQACEQGQDVIELQVKGEGEPGLTKNYRHGGL